MTNLQQLLEEKYPLTDLREHSDEAIQLLMREAFEKGYKAGAKDKEDQLKKEGKLKSPTIFY